VTNLVGNAVKFTEHGGVMVRARLAGTTDGESVVRVEVADSGIGIAPEQLERLFTSFTQADSSTTRRYGGTGLGLAICKRLVELMGGTIGVESAPGQGAIFWFTLPFEPADANGESAPPPAVLRDLRALIVDGSAMSRALLRQHLAAAQMASGEAGRADAALAELRAAAARGAPFALAIVDLDVPEQGGLSVVTAIRAEPALDATRVVLLTPAELDGQAARPPQFGIAVRVAKPIRRAPLYRALVAALDQPAPGTATTTAAPTAASGDT
jgi:two-component system sensor histidine kinase/response regulator